MRIALLLALLPPAGATVACNCAETGSPVVLTAATIARNPQIELAGDAKVLCVQRNPDDHCTTFWIVPTRAGTVTFTVVFDDGTRLSDTTEYVYDTEYPCRDNIRPVHDKVTRL